MNETDLDIIIPVYDEHADVVARTVSEIRTALQGREGVHVIVVDDGSREECGLSGLASDPGLTLVQHAVNRGYGMALKTGILTGSAPWVAIIDADGTYPPGDLPRLLAELPGHDMVVGIRVGEVREIPWLRRMPKWVLNQLASYMAGVPIRDLNSGMRIFSRSLALRFWGLLPAGFSFTSTLTMGSTMGGYRVAEVPIDYFKRVGSSSIHPTRDTVRFLRIILRLGGLFAPRRVFTPIAVLLLFAGLSKGFFRDYLGTGSVGNVAVVLMIAGLQVWLMGFLADLVVASRMLGPGRPNE